MTTPHNVHQPSHQHQGHHQPHKRLFLVKPQSQSSKTKATKSNTWITIQNSRHFFLDPQARAPPHPVHHNLLSLFLFLSSQKSTKKITSRLQIQQNFRCPTKCGYCYQNPAQLWYTVNRRMRIRASGRLARRAS